MDSFPLNTNPQPTVINVIVISTAGVISVTPVTNNTYKTVYLSASYTI